MREKNFQMLLMLYFKYPLPLEEVLRMFNMKDGEENKCLEGGYNTNFQYIQVSLMNSSTGKTLTFNVAES